MNLVIKKSGCPKGKGWRRWQTGGTTKLFDPKAPVKVSAPEPARELSPLAAKVKTLADMSEEEVRELEKKLGAKLSPNAKRKI